MARQPFVRVLRIAAAFAILPAVALAGQTLAGRYARPVPATYDTLARFLPSGAPVPELKPSATPGIYEFEGSGEGGEFRGEVSAHGTLLWLASSTDLDQLPADLRHLLLRRESFGDPNVERVRIMAFEVETSRPDGSEHERFLDALGNLLFEVDKDPEAEDTDVAESFEDLEAPVAQAILNHLGQRPPTRLQKEVELGSEVHAAKWRGSHGEQEVKVLDNGLTLFLELPKDEPVPEAVLGKVPPGAEIEALILETFWFSNKDGSVLHAMLSNGRPIFVPKRHHSE